MLRSLGAPDPVQAYRLEVRFLYRVAILVFLLTVGIGVLNGLDLMEFERDTLMTHVHAGTLGWITLSVLAFTLWLMGGEERPLARWSSRLAVASVPPFVVAFWVGNDAITAILGSAVLLAIFGFTAFAVSSYPASARRPPHLATAAGLVTLSIGSTVGLLLQIQNASGSSFLPTEAIGAHVGAQVVGYLILVGMALVEWRLLPEAALTRGAIAQIALLFAGGLLASVGALIESDALLGIFIPLELAAVVIFLVRVSPRLVRVHWLHRGDERFFALIVPYLVANVILLVVLIAGVVSGRYADFDVIPPWLVFAFDHAMFIGVMTNGLVGLGMVLAAEGQRAWADHLAFWAINAGLIGFAIGLMTRSTALQRLSTPVMGMGILLGLVSVWAEMRSRSTSE